MLKHTVVAAVALFLLSVPAAARQTVPEPSDEFRRYEIFFAPLTYARQQGNNFAGGGLAFAARIKPNLAVVADLTGDFQQSKGTVSGTSVTSDIELWAYRFGPRYSFYRSGRVSLFGHALAGGSRLVFLSKVQQSGTSYQTSTHTDGFSFAAGGGADVVWKQWLAFRVFQLDYSFVDQANLHNGFRVSGGLNFRFGH